MIKAIHDASRYVKFLGRSSGIHRCSNMFKKVSVNLHLSDKKLFYLSEKDPGLDADLHLPEY